MSGFDAATQEAMDFYAAHYCLSEPIKLVAGEKRKFLGTKKTPRACRFCSRVEPEVTFRHDAHALPVSFGNSVLFSNYECDACNHLFGEGIENQLANWTKPMRTISRIKGRRGVPTFKKGGDDEGWRLECSDNGFQVREYEDDPFFVIDREKNQVRFDLQRDTYTPVAVLKGLVKIGLTLLPDCLHPSYIL